MKVGNTRKMEDGQNVERETGEKRRNERRKDGKPEVEEKEMGRIREERKNKIWGSRWSERR